MFRGFIFLRASFWYSFLTIVDEEEKRGTKKKGKRKRKIGFKAGR